MHEASRWCLKDYVLAQKALQRYETETGCSFLQEQKRELFPRRGDIDFFTKRKQKKIELLARPGLDSVGVAMWGPPAS